MLRPYGLGMASDAIAHRYGFDGNEGSEVRHMCDRFGHLGVRSTFAANTYYPEISGGYYQNRAIYALIDDTLRFLAVLPVLWDCYYNSSNSVVPIEGEGQLLMDETYALVDEKGSQKGLLQIWKFHAGGGGRYYSDNVIFDFVLPRALTGELVDRIEQKCAVNGVRFRREASFEMD